MLLSVAMDTTGKFPNTARSIESSTTPTTAAEVADLVLLRLREPPAYSGHMRLRITVDSAVTIDVGRSQYCPPVLANREELTRVLAGANAQAKRSGNAQVRVYIDEEGAVTDTEIEQSSGDDLLDGLALGVAHAMVFKPLIVDFSPEPVWVQVPVQFTAQ